DNQSPAYTLCWQFDIRLKQPDDVWRVWVNAYDGAVQAHQSQSRACNSHRGTFNSTYYATRGFDVRKGKQIGNDYVLKDCRGDGIHTKYHRLDRFGETGSWAWTSNIRHRGTDWRNNDRAATTAHWAAQAAWDYFSDNFDWIGPANEGLPLRIWVDWLQADETPMPNARYLFDNDRHYLYLGEVQGQSLATLDVVGHEFAHGMISKTAGLTYAGESGALHESFADILGTLVERSVLEDEFDWVLGSELGGLRDMAHPHSYAQPEYYGESDPFWISDDKTDCTGSGVWTSGGEPACDVHTNSGVQNRWFYLLSVGGKQAGTTVYGIGIDRVAQIVFRSLKTYLQPLDTYTDARMASIQAAADLFGACSNELAQVKNAWAAVGVGGANTAICVEILGADDICSDESFKELTYEVRAIEGAEFFWEPLPVGWAYAISGDKGQYLTLTYIPDDAPPISLEVTARLGAREEQLQKNVIFVECKTDTNQTNPPGEGPTTRLKFPEVRLIPNPCKDRVMVF
ncbi:MAG: M4 family metallopeptidase, partial [Bacteroidota bacterium]